MPYKMQHYHIVHPRMSTCTHKSMLGGPSRKVLQHNLRKTAQVEHFDKLSSNFPMFTTIRSVAPARFSAGLASCNDRDVRCGNYHKLTRPHTRSLDRIPNCQYDSFLKRLHGLPASFSLSSFHNCLNELPPQLNPNIKFASANSCATRKCPYLIHAILQSWSKLQSSNPALPSQPKDTACLELGITTWTNYVGTCRLTVRSACIIVSKLM